MANVAFPRVDFSDFSFELVTPDQSLQDSPLTGNTNHWGNGIAFWRGALTYGPYETAEERALYSEVTSFMTSLGGYTNTFDLPWPDLDQASRFPGSLTIVNSERSNTFSELQVSVEAAPANGVGFIKGDMLTINNRIHQCVSNQVGDLVVVTPGKIDGAVGDPINFATPSIRCRMDMEMTPTFSMNLHFFDMVRMAWRQADV